MQKIHGTIQDIAAIGDYASTGEFGYSYSHQVRIQDTIYFLNPDEAQLKLLQSAKLNSQPITISVPYNGLIETILNHSTQDTLNTPIPERDANLNRFIEVYFVLSLFLVGLGAVYYAW